MTTLKTIQISKLDTAAAIETASKVSPDISFPDGGTLAVFEFPRTPDVIDALLNFEQHLSVDAQTLLRTRLHLLRRAKGVR